ncbi:MAG: hypothetical protein ABIP93_20120 [Gemmatimonadaceae bacterium]
MSHSIDADERLVRCLAWGELSSEDLYEHYRKILIDLDFRPDYRQLGDLRDVTRLSADSTAIAAAASLAVFAPGTRRALIAPSDITFGLARMFASYAEDVGQLVRVFRDAREAEEWLGLGGTTDE